MIIYDIKPHVVMDFLTDILSTIQRQSEDSYNQNQVNDNQNQVNDNQNQGHDDNNLQCEKQIIQCQITNDRLLGSTSTSLRKKYGNEIVNRAIRRIAKRRLRGKCSRTAEINKLSKTFKPIIDHYFKKKDESFLNSAL